jgi:hypothetical protein
MALQVVSPAVSVYRVLRVDEKTHQEVSEEHTFKRGEVLPDWLSPHQQFVLSQTGMAREVGDLVDPGLIEAANPPAPVVLPEHSPRMVLGTGVTEPMRVESTFRDGVQVDAGVAPLEALPADTDTKPAWEDAAVALGLSRNKAESMKKADLVAAVKDRQAKAEEARDLGGPDSTLPPLR